MTEVTPEESAHADAPSPQTDSVHEVVSYLLDKVHYLLDKVQGTSDEDPADAVAIDDPVPNGTVVDSNASNENNSDNTSSH